MAKDRTPTGKGASGARSAGQKGRTRPPTQVVTQQRRPWGLIAGALAVVLFAVGAIGFALARVNESEANQIASPDELDGLQSYDYSDSVHTADPVDYEESPPVGGPHADSPQWADCTGTVYDVDIRHENAVHSLEHGAVWITYNPDLVSGDDIAALEELVAPGRMLSPYEGLDSPISIQSWNHQLKVDAADDPRLKQYADFFTFNPEFHPEPGASCQNPAFVDNPLLEADDGPAPAAPSEAPATEAPSSDAPASDEATPSGSAEPSEPATSGAATGSSAPATQ